MKCGLAYQFSTPSFDDRAVRSTYAEQLDQIALADDLGFDDIWVSEHHFTENNYLTSPLVMAGAVAMRTRRANVGIGLAIAPLHHPIRLAEDCAVADNLCDGRLMLALGIGYRDAEYAGFNVDRSQRASYTEEVIDVVRRAWAPGEFDYQGRHFDFRAVNCTPKPVQEQIPIWVAGGVPAAIRRAARTGDGWFALTVTADQLALYRRELDAAGKDGSNPSVAAIPFIWLYVTDDPERTWSIIGPHAVKELNLFAEWSVPGMHFETVQDARNSGLVHVCTPDEALEKLAAMHGATPLERCYFIPNLRGAPVDEANRSLELFAASVLPKLSGL